MTSIDSTTPSWRSERLPLRWTLSGMPVQPSETWSALVEGPDPSIRYEFARYLPAVRHQDDTTGASVPQADDPSLLYDTDAGLIEEQSANRDFPKIQLGKMHWMRPAESRRSEQTSPEAAVLVARLEIPAADLSADVLVCCRRPSAGTAELELQFRFTGKLPNDPVRDLEEPQSRATGDVRGDTIRARIVRPSVQEFRMILTGASEAERERNRRLLGSQPWIDVPIKFASGRKAILTFTQGKYGRDVIHQALD